MRYYVAATGSRRVQLGGLRREWKRMPSGLIHAVDEQDEVVCGARPEPLHPFPDKDWEALWASQFTKCERCAELIRP